MASRIPDFWSSGLGEGGQSAQNRQEVLRVLGGLGHRAAAGHVAAHPANRNPESGASGLRISFRIPDLGGVKGRTLNNSSRDTQMNPK